MIVVHAPVEVQTVSLIRDRSGEAYPAREVPERAHHICAGLIRVPDTSYQMPHISERDVETVLAEVHTREYLTFLANQSRMLASGKALFEHPFVAPGVAPDTPVEHGTYERALTGAHIAISAADLVASGKADIAYALTRPPGHHAGPDWCGGYCYLNNATLAVAALKAAGFSRLALIDIDIHFGNGSAAILGPDRDTFFGSIHGSTDESYPYIPTNPAHANQVFVPFATAPSEEAFVDAVADVLAQVAAFDCEALVVSLGYDTIAGDPHGTWSLTPSTFRRIGRLLVREETPLCIVQEGGYALDSLESCAFELGTGLREGKHGHTKG